ARRRGRPTPHAGFEEQRKTCMARRQRHAGARSSCAGSPIRLTNHAPLLLSPRLLTLLSSAGASAAISPFAPCRAAVADTALLSPDVLQQHESFVGISVFLGLVLLSTITALLHLMGRNRWLKRENALTTEVTELRARLDRAEVFLAAERQIIIAWGAF